MGTGHLEAENGFWLLLPRVTSFATTVSTWHVFAWITLNVLFYT